MLDMDRPEKLDVAVPAANGRLSSTSPGCQTVCRCYSPKGVQPGSAITGIDLWRVDANGEDRALVASAGTVAPVARITNLVRRQMDEAVAYAVLVPGVRARGRQRVGTESCLWHRLPHRAPPVRCH